MTARARIYYQFWKNKDGTLKSEDQLRAKQIDHIGVHESDEGQKSYWMTYSIEDEQGKEHLITIDFFSRGLGITIEGEDIEIAGGIGEDGDHGESATWRINTHKDAESEYFTYEFLEYVRKNKLSLNKAIVSLDFSDFK